VKQARAGNSRLKSTVFSLQSTIFSPWSLFGNLGFQVEMNPKPQAPSTKEAPSFKPQEAPSDQRKSSVAGLELGHWVFSGAWGLVLGD
jgi:hypothetical protein